MKVIHFLMKYQGKRKECFSVNMYFIDMQNTHKKCVRNKCFTFYVRIKIEITFVLYELLEECSFCN